MSSCLISARIDTIRFCSTVLVTNSLTKMVVCYRFTLLGIPYNRGAANVVVVETTRYDVFSQSNAVKTLDLHTDELSSIMREIINIVLLSNYL